MNTTIELDQNLIKQAVDASGLADGKATVEEALRVFLKLLAEKAEARKKPVMHVDIEIDDALIKEAMQCGSPDLAAAVEEGLRLLIYQQACEDMTALFGKIPLDLTIDEIRRGRS